MRSIRYVFNNIPSNMDDCLDMSRKHRPCSVEIFLSTSETALELCLMKELSAHLNWDFESQKISIDMPLGVCFSHETIQRQKLSVDNANRRLGNLISEMQQLGVLVVGDKSAFDYTTIYCSKDGEK